MIDSCTSPVYPPTMPSSGASPWSPIAPGATDGETQSAIDDAADTGIVTTIGGAPPAAPDTYNAAGLLDSFVQAGTPVADPDETDSGLAPGIASEDGAVYDAEAANGTNPDAASTPGYANLWGNTLQSDPWDAGTVVADAGDQGLLSTLPTLSTWA